MSPIENLTERLAAISAVLDPMLAEIAASPRQPKRESRTCLSYWFPKIEGLVPVPRTEIVTTDCNLFELMDGDIPDGWCSFLADMNHAIAKLTDNASPSPPVFLRTGHTSGKHNWKNTCHCDLRESTLADHVTAIVEYSMLVDIAGLPVDVWAVRELLDVPSQFKCTAYGNMPVTPERRYFVDGPDLLYSIPYWPDLAIEHGKPDDPDWQSKMALVQMDFPQEAAEMARKCGAACGGKWSVDVLLTNRGFVVTDMAEAEKSWGWKREQ